MSDRPSWLPLKPSVARRRAEPAAPAHRERTAPSLATDGARARMIDGLRRAGLRDPQVLEAMAQVPRHLFVDAALASRGYEDVALPIGRGQTISKPSTVARMIELVAEPLAPARRAGARALEVGTGCGYQAAVLSRVFGEVVSVERLRGLHEQARTNLRAMRLPNLRLVFGDGNLGVPQAAPFDAIIVAAAAGDSIPESLLEQMRIGARLVAPVGSTRQSLHLVERVERDRWQLTILDAVRFVPLRTGTV
ncbi:MAG: protein-L-isoaspartate(D-aspartate) O-methyltransferase [Burkholderiaceae bacterium]|nr:protein-L-isoaspartate(D-aspartate) O-methyltransferase [Burkholderiaceae bacterium]